MRTLLAAAVILSGCESTHDFRLEDLRELTPGVSTKADLDRIFGPREFVVSTMYDSYERDRVVPPAPISFVSWPLFLHTHDQGYAFTVRVDGDVIVSGALEITEITSTRILLCLGPSDTTVHLTEAEVALLRELEWKGIAVTIGVTPIRCMSGIIGWVSVPLEEYLRK